MCHREHVMRIKKLDKMRLYWLDDICWEHQTIPALEEYTGHYPEKENEIMLSGTALRSMGITPAEGRNAYFGDL